MTTRAEKFQTPPDKATEAKKFLDDFGVNVSEMTDEEAIQLMEKIHAAKEENIQVLTRGATTESMERLLARIPKGYVGQFVSDHGEDDFSVNAAEAMGWKVFHHEDASRESETGGVTTRVKLGDCVLMYIPVEKYVAIRMGKRERNAARREAHRPKKQAKSAKEEVFEEVPIVPDLFGKST